MPAPPPAPQAQPRPGTCGPLEAEAEVGVVAVLAGAPVAAGLAVAFIDVGLAVVARVARPAQAGEGGNAVLAGPVVTGVGVALVNVHLTVGPCVACRAGAEKLSGAAPRARGRPIPGRHQPTQGHLRSRWGRLGMSGDVPHCPGQSLTLLLAPGPEAPE